MRNLWGASLVCLSLATAAAMPAKADGVLVPIPPYPDSSKTTAFSIDNNNKLAGSYVANSDGNEHGFTGTLDGTYSSPIDVGNGGTEIRGANDAGWLMGFSNSLSGDPNSDPSFQIRPSDSKARFITKKARHLKGVVQGINASNTFTGSYLYKQRVTKGYVGVYGQYRRDLGLKNANGGYAGRGINDNGDVVGWYVDPATGAQNGLLKSGGTATMITYPGSDVAYTVMEGINNNNQAVGQYADTSGIVHGFIVDLSTNTFTQIDDPAATQFTQVWNVNDAGTVTVSSDAGTYIWCATSCQAPGHAVHGKKTVVKELPRFRCDDRSCVFPVSQGRVVAQPAKPKGLIYQ